MSRVDNEVQKQAQLIHDRIIYESKSKDPAKLFALWVRAVVTQINLYRYGLGGGPLNGEQVEEIAMRLLRMFANEHVFPRYAGLLAKGIQVEKLWRGLRIKPEKRRTFIDFYERREDSASLKEFVDVVMEMWSALEVFQKSAKRKKSIAKAEKREIKSNNTMTLRFIVMEAAKELKNDLELKPTSHFTSDTSESVDTQATTSTMTRSTPRSETQSMSISSDESDTPTLPMLLDSPPSAPPFYSSDEDEVQREVTVVLPPPISIKLEPAEQNPIRTKKEERSRSPKKRKRSWQFDESPPLKMKHDWGELLERYSIDSGRPFVELRDELLTMEKSKFDQVMGLLLPDEPERWRETKEPESMRRQRLINIAVRKGQLPKITQSELHSRSLPIPELDKIALKSFPSKSKKADRISFLQSQGLVSGEYKPPERRSRGSSAAFNRDAMEFRRFAIDRKRKREMHYSGNSNVKTEP